MLVTIVSELKDPSGDAIAGKKVTFKLVPSIYDEVTQYMAKIEKAITDEQGRFEQELWANQDRKHPSIFEVQLPDGSPPFDIVLPTYRVPRVIELSELRDECVDYYPDEVPPLLNPGLDEEEVQGIVDESLEDYTTTEILEAEYLKSAIAIEEYLRKDSAIAEYLSIEVAERDYLKSAIAESTYLTETQGDLKYLSITDAGNTYLTEVRGDEIYLKSAIAESDYLSKMIAAQTYLTQVDAGNTYLSLTESNDFLKKSEAKKIYVPADGIDFIVSAQLKKDLPTELGNVPEETWETIVTPVIDPLIEVFFDETELFSYLRSNGYINRSDLISPDTGEPINPGDYYRKIECNALFEYKGIAYSREESDIRFLPSDYEPPSVDLSDYLTVEQGDDRYLPSDYEPPQTEVDLSEYLKTEDAIANLETELGNYLTTTSAEAIYATKNNLNNYALKTDLEPFLTSDNLDPYALTTDLRNYAPISSLSAYLTVAEASTTYAPIGAYLTISDLENYALKTDLTDFITLDFANENFAPSGNYLIPEDLNDYALKTDLTDFITEAEADEKYQPKGEASETGSRFKSFVVNEASYSVTNEMHNGIFKVYQTVNILLEEPIEIGSCFAFVFLNEDAEIRFETSDPFYPGRKTLRGYVGDQLALIRDEGREGEAIWLISGSIVTPQPED